MLDAITMHHTFVAIGFSVAACHTRTISRADVIFMLIVVSLIVTGIRQIFFAGSQAEGHRSNHQAIGQECFHE